MSTTPSTPSPSRWASLRARWEKARTRWWVRWGTDLLLLGLILTVASAFQTRHHVSGTVPSFSLKTLDGKTVSSADLLGKPAVLVFWAPWCGVCQAENDNVSRAMRWAGERGRVLSVAAGWNDVRQVEGYVQRNGVDYPVLLGGDEQTEAFHVEAFPTAYFLDEQGRIKGSAVGYTTTLGFLARLLW